MEGPERYNWKGADKKISELTEKEVILIYFLKKISPFLTFITKYFPFSLLWQDRRFHYKFKEVDEMDDLIIKIASEKGCWFRFYSFEKDKQFLKITGKFISGKKSIKEHALIKHFESVLAKKDIYISKPDKETVQFLIARGR